MLRTVLSLGMVSMALSGCMTAMSQEQQAAVAQQVRDCRAYQKSQVDGARCINALEQQYTPSSPLLTLKLAKRLELSAQVDAGRITPDESEAEFMRYTAQLQIMDQQQQAAAAADFGNRLAAAGTALQSAGAPPPVMPVAPNPIPQRTQCQIWRNNSVTCQ
jgi:hypothetical protein